MIDALARIDPISRSAKAILAKASWRGRLVPDAHGAKSRV